jgi:hypothetical protein
VPCAKGITLGDISAPEILAMYQHRRQLRAPIIEKQEKVRNLYDNQTDVLLPDMGRSEKPAVPNLLKQGIDQSGARIAGGPPTLFCPPRNTKKREQDAATTRRKALLGLWEMNRLFNVLNHTRARYLVGYSCAPVTIDWDRKMQIPRWNLRDPIGCFPTPNSDLGNFTPDDVIFVYSKTRQWVIDNYGDQAATLWPRGQTKPDAKVTILEYENAEWCVTIAAQDSGPGVATPIVGSNAVVLEKYPNRAGICRAVVPNLFSLNAAAGQFDGIIPMYGMQAELMALAVLAAKKGIFPDLALVGEGGNDPELIDDQWYDGHTGRINRIRNGNLEVVQMAPGYQTNPMIDRIERSARVESSIPAEWGGESTTGIRTGRRGDAVISAAVDFTMQEAQELIAAATQEENKRAIAVWKAHAGNAPASFYVNWRGTNENIEFVPNEVFTTDENLVYFAHAGQDTQQVTVMVGQLLGLGTVSQRWARENLPVIEDADAVEDQIVAEKVRDALMGGFLMRVQSGEVSLADAAWFAQQVKQNKLDPEDAMIALDERVKQRQASSGAPGAPDGPVQPGTPEAQAGLAAGTAAEGQALPPTVPQPTDALTAASGLMNRLRQVSRPVASGAA